MQSSQFGFECSVCLEQACGVKVFHNTTFATAPRFSSVEWRFANTNAEITNNLASHNLKERDGAAAALAGNISGASSALFVDAATGDLHLAGSAAAAIDQGVPIAAGMSNDDVDGAPRDAAPDIGADELLANLPYGLYLPLVLKVN